MSSVVNTYCLLVLLYVGNYGVSASPCATGGMMCLPLPAKQKNQNEDDFVNNLWPDEKHAPQAQFPFIYLVIAVFVALCASTILNMYFCSSIASRKLVWTKANREETLAFNKNEQQNP
eukprot:228038_1